MPKKSKESSERNESTTEDQITSVRNALIERGLHLELSTYETLKQKGWLARLHSSFWDFDMPPEETSLVQEIRRAWEGPSEVIYRSIDLVASKTTQSKSPSLSSFQITFVIECKHRSNENWVFYRQNQDLEGSKKLIQALVNELVDKIGAPKVNIDLDHLSLQEYSSFNHLKYEVWRKYLDGKYVKEIRKSSHHSNAKLNRVAVSHTTVFGAGNLDNVRNACEQVLGACDFQDKVFDVFHMANMKDPSNIMHWRIYPVVVFDGPLWEVSLNDDSELELHPLDWVTYLYSRHGKGYLIDVVRHEQFETYLNEIEKELLAGQVGLHVE